MADILTFSIQSGSNGNCIYVEAGDVRLLFDAGVSGKKVRERMAVHDRKPHEVDALIISHGHGDHIGCAGVYQRMFGLPLYLTKAAHTTTRCRLGRLHDVRYFESGDVLEIKRVRVHTIRTPHDGEDTVMFVVEFEGKRLAIMTDLGHPFPALADTLATVDAAYLESNYDPRMLAEGPYPWDLQERISGDGGHISNEEAALLVRNTAKRQHKWIALAHLSEQNNCPDVALATHQQTTGTSFPYEVSSRYEVSPIRTV